MPKETSDDFQNTLSTLKDYDAALKRAKETQGAVHLKYFGCEKEPGVADNLKQVDDAVKAAEDSRKIAADAFAKADEKVRQYIGESHGRVVENFYTNAGVGSLGETVTTTFKLDGDNKVVFQVTRDPLQSAIH